MIAPLRAPISAIASGGKLLPSHQCVSAKIEGVFLLRNSIPRSDSSPAKSGRGYLAKSYPMMTSTKRFLCINKSI